MLIALEANTSDDSRSAVDPCLIRSDAARPGDYLGAIAGRASGYWRVFTRRVGPGLALVERESRATVVEWFNIIDFQYGPSIR